MKIPFLFNKKIKALIRYVKIRKIKNIHDSKISNYTLIHPAAKITNSTLSGNIIVEEQCDIINSFLMGTIKIGKYTSLNGPNISIYCLLHGISVGAFCSVARNVTMQEYNHFTDHCSTFLILHHIFGCDWREEMISKGPIIIGNDVWIGMNSSILSGVTIGDGAIIGANSLVNKNVPPYSITAGIPAAIIGYRFNERIVSRLLELQWWYWNIEKIKLNKDLFIGKLTEKKLETIIEKSAK